MKKEYRVLWSHDSEALSSNVTHCLNNGWELAGGLQIIQEGENTDQCFAQAIIRIIEPTKP